MTSTSFAFNHDYNKHASNRHNYDEWQEFTRENIKGDFQLIDKRFLYVDHIYQRDTHKKSVISKMAKDFNWLQFGVITVAARSNGDFFVIDGQNRIAAAMMCKNISKVPCMVFHISTKKLEALGFLNINSHRVAVKSYDKFKAMIVAGDKTAILLNDIIEAKGYHISKSQCKNGIRCVFCAYERLKANESAFLEVWNIVADIHAGEPIIDDVIKGLFYLRSNGVNITDYSSRLKKIGIHQILGEIKSSCAFFKARNARNAAFGIANAINNRARSNRITLFEAAR